jgi:hypothetical protein
MKSTTKPIQKLSDYLEYISNVLIGKDWIFRGHEDTRFTLKPSVARIKPREGTIQSMESKMLIDYQMINGDYWLSHNITDYQRDF